LDNGLNANMLFRWRREYRAGTLCLPMEAAPALLPVSVADQAETSIVELPNPSTRFGNAPASKPAESVIEIQIAGAAVRIEGDVDVVRLGAVLAALRG
jgi:transposase